MSDQPIEFSGDALAQRVPLLGAFQENLASIFEPLADVGACRWAEGAPKDDELTAQTLAAVRQMMGDYILPAYELLGEAVGLQGDKLDMVRRIGDNTEATTTEIAGGWGGGRH
jgi:hypothetical protein